MGTKDYDSSFCRGLVFCTQFKNTFALSILTYPQKQQSQTGVCCICVCPQLIIPSGKSILLLGIFMPFGAVKGGQSHENNGNVKKCAVGKYPKSEKHGNTAQLSEVERSGTQENCGGIGSGCRLRLRPLPVLRRRQSQRVARIDPNAVVVDKNIAENDRFDLFSR